jgi:Chalcone isomerase-like
VILAASGPTELVMHFVRDVSAKDITGAWDDGFASNAKAQLPALKERVIMLNGWMTDMKTGQQMVFSFKRGLGLTVTVNGAVKGTIKGDDFAKAFFSLWLGPRPANPELKSGLLGGTCG